MKENLCPLCKSEQFESNLKRDILLEEIVLCFQSVREDLIKMATTGESESVALAANDKFASKNASRSAAWTPDPEVIDVADESDVDKSGPSASSGPSTPLPTSGTAECPICGDRSMSAEYLQLKHIDECLSGKKRPVGVGKRKRNEISLFFQPRKKAKEIDHQQFYFEQAEKHHHDTKRMPRIDFGSLSTPKLKEKMAGLKISVLGLRSQLELRYNQYMLFFNSNLDTNRPVSELELRQRLNQWEKSHLAFKPLALNSIFGDSLTHKSISDKDFPIKAWVEKYHDEFRELVRAARKSRLTQGKNVELTEGSRTIQSTSTQVETTQPEDTEAPHSTPSADLRQLRSTTKPKDPDAKIPPSKTHSTSELISASLDSTNRTRSQCSPHTTPCTEDPGSSVLLMGILSADNNNHADRTGTFHPSSPHSAAADNPEIGNKSKKADEAFDLSTLILFVPLHN